jgi:hypothetical protein
MLVFQYGSNCLDSEINSSCRLCGDAEFVDTAETVEDFELAFDVWSCNRACAASNIVRKPGGKIWGVLYKVPDYLIERKPPRRVSVSRLTRSKVRAQTTSERIKVRRPDGKIVSALTYTVRCPTAGLKTNVDYVRHIVCGLREHGVAKNYIARVKAIAAANNPDIAAEVEKL